MGYTNRLDLAFCSATMLGVLSLLLGANLVQLVGSFPEIDVPKVTVKATTSIVQSTPSGQQQQTIAAQTISSNGRQQRDLSVNNQQYHDAIVRDKSGPYDVRFEPSEPILNLGYLKLNPNSRVLELQPATTGYRQSVSTSWNARGTPLPIQSRTGSLGGKTTTNDQHCQKRSLSRTLRRAKNVLTDNFASLKQYASTGNLIMLSSSLLAGAIPLIALLLPGDQAAASPSREQIRRAGSTGGAATAAAAEQAQSLLSRFNPLQGRVDSIMSWIERSVEHLPNFPHLHPQECVKRSICEAHNEPTKYGAIGFILRLLFPATNLSSTDRMDNMEYKVINKYRYAAGFGLSKRLDNNGTGSSVCKEKYEDCLVSLLDVAQNLMDKFLR